MEMQETPDPGEQQHPLDMPQDAPEDEVEPFYHTPDMVYVYEEPTATQHPVLGLIQPGENQWPTEEPTTVQALEAMVEAGQLTQVSREAPEPEEPDEEAGAPA